MRALLRALATAMFLVCGLALAAPSAAEKGDLLPMGTADPSPDLMRALMAWASPRLGLAAPEALPRIVRASHCDMNAIASPGAGCPEPGAPAVKALYSEGVLWLNTEWRSDNVADVSFLLHELVHHMQFHAGIEPIPCFGEAIEKPAYETHFAFLEAAGLDPYATTGLNALFLIFVTACLEGR